MLSNEGRGYCITKANIHCWLVRTTAVANCQKCTYGLAFVMLMTLLPKWQMTVLALPISLSSCMPANMKSMFLRSSFSSLPLSRSLSLSQQGLSCSCSLLPFSVMSEGITSSSDSQPRCISAAIVMRIVAAHFPLAPRLLSSCRSRRERRDFGLVMTSFQRKLPLHKA